MKNMIHTPWRKQYCKGEEEKKGFKRRKKEAHEKHHRQQEKNRKMAQAVTTSSTGEKEKLYNLWVHDESTWADDLVVQEGSM